MDKADCLDLVKFSGCAEFPREPLRRSLDVELAHFVQVPHYETRGDDPKLGR
jgi:hypothetical protein